MEFLILGPLEVRDGLRTVRLGAAKQRALLGVLLLHANEPVSTARLVDELWGERPPATAEKLVQGYVHALRKQLGGDAPVTQAPGYCLRVGPRALDLLEFERLTEEAGSAEPEQSIELRRQALSIWRGDPLADVVLEGPARHTIARLSELRLTTQIDRIEAELELGRSSELIGELESLAAAHPYQERLQAQLMLALYRSGRQADALQSYQKVRRVLSDELGLQPSQELRDLEAAILRQDEALSVDGQVTSVPRTPARPPGSPPASTRRRRRQAVVLIAAVVGLAVAATAAALVVRGDSTPIAAPPNSVAVIDPETDRVVYTIPVGIRPGPVAVGAGSVWVGNLEDKTLTRIDLATRQVVRTITLGATPTGTAIGAGAVWVAHGFRGTLSRVDPQFGEVRTMNVTSRAFGSLTGSVGYGAGSVWAVYGDSTLARIQPRAFRKIGSTFAGARPSAVAVGSGSVWVVSAADAGVLRFNPATFERGPLRTISVGRRPTGIAYGEGAVWVANEGDDAVARVDPSSNSSFTISVGDQPTAVAEGAGAVWVANSGDGTVSRIDPLTRRVVKTIAVGNAPSGIAVGRGVVWVTVQRR